MLLYRAHFWNELLVGVLFFALSICLVVRLNREIFFLYCFVFLSIVIACCPCIIATKLDFKVLCISIGQFFIVKFVLCFALICTWWMLRFVSRWSTLVRALTRWSIETCFSQLIWFRTCRRFLEVEHLITQQSLDIWVVTALSLGSYSDTFSGCWTVLFGLLLIRDMSGWVNRSSLRLHFRGQFACGHGWGWPLVRDWPCLLWVASSRWWGNCSNCCHWGCVVGLAWDDRVSSPLTLVYRGSEASSSATTVFECMTVRSYR